MGRQNESHTSDPGNRGAETRSERPSEDWLGKLQQLQPSFLI